MTTEGGDGDLVDVDLSDDDGFPEYRNLQAPGAVAVRAAIRGKGPAPREGLATRRQLRALALSPGGHAPVARLICRGGNRWAWLYRLDLAAPKRVPTLAQELALDRAMAARQTCPECRNRYYACLPLRTQGRCDPCEMGIEPSPDTVMSPAPGHPPARRLTYRRRKRELTMLEAVLGGAFVLAGTALGSVLERRAARSHTAAADLAAHRQAVRDTIVDLVSALSVHRGDLYTRWDLAHDTTAADADTTQARHTSHTSRATVTAALYRLRALTTDPVLLRAATETVAASYAVKAKGEDLTGVSEQDLAGRYRRAVAADDALLTLTAAHLAPALP